MPWLAGLCTELGELCLGAYVAMLMDFRHHDTVGLGPWGEKG